MQCYHSRDDGRGEVLVRVLAVHCDVQVQQARVSVFLVPLIAVHSHLMRSRET